MELLQEHSQPVNHVLLAYSIEYQKKKLAGGGENEKEDIAETGEDGIEGMDVESKSEPGERARVVKTKEKNHNGSNNNFKKHAPTQNRTSFASNSNNQNNTNNADANPRPKKKHKNFNSSS